MAEFIRHPDRYKEHHLRPEDWWSDHFDSPLFFVLALGDYVAATGDTDELARHRATVTAVIERYFRLAGPDGLPLKPRNDRDWADNVFREGLVAYDLGLWVGALDVVARAGGAIDASLAERARAAAAAARQTIDRRLWTGANYADYATPDGFVEDHLTLDSLTLARYDAIPEPRARALLDAVAARLNCAATASSPTGTGASSAPFRRSSGARHPGEDRLPLPLPQRLGLALARRRLRDRAASPRHGRCPLCADPLVGLLSGEGLGRPGRILRPAVRPRIAAAGLERDAGGRGFGYRAAVLAEGTVTANDKGRLRMKEGLWLRAIGAAVITAASVGWAQAQTLVVWDDYTDVGQNAVIEQLNKNFMAAHPGVTIERTPRTFDDLSLTLKLAVSAGNGPQVTKVNQGAGDMGTMVKEKLLLPIDAYITQYGWDKRQSDSVLARDRWSDSGQFGEGPTYGISGLGEMVGLYYNSKLLADAGITDAARDASRSS